MTAKTLAALLSYALLFLFVVGGGFGFLAPALFSADSDIALLLTPVVLAITVLLAFIVGRAFWRKVAPLLSN